LQDREGQRAADADDTYAAGAGGSSNGSNGFIAAAGRDFFGRTQRINVYLYLFLFLAPFFLRGALFFPPLLPGLYIKTFLKRPSPTLLLRTSLSS
jgi:hypothetical protein